jgi:heme oxygenase
MKRSFYQQLVADTAQDEAEFRAIPLILKAVISGVDRALYVEFLGSAYHHVRHTCPLLGLALSHCGPEDDVYRAGLLQYLEEEKGHETWILDDINALGGDWNQVAEGPAPFAVRLMVGYAYYAIERISPYALLGMVHVLEGMSVALARAAAISISASLEVAEGSGGFSYLVSHGHLDQNHVGLFAKLLDRIDTPEHRIVVIQAAKDFYRLYGDVFRSLTLTREVDRAA